MDKETETKMNRRTLLKSLMASPLLGLFSVKAVDKPLYRSGIEVADEPVHFWMQTYGPCYIPLSLSYDLPEDDSLILGIYHGEELKGVKAIDCSIGDRIVLADGSRYMCYGPNASKLGIHIIGKGVFLNEPA